MTDTVVTAAPWERPANALWADPLRKRGPRSIS